MDYRSATAGDAPVLAEMNRQLIQDEGHRNPMTLAQLELRLAGWLARHEYQGVIFARAGIPVGYALYRREPDFVYLRQFFVRPEFRRQGMGRDALAWLRQNAWPGAPRLRVEVLAGNAAGQAFWRTMGFTDYSVILEREGGMRTRSSGSVEENPGV